METVGACASAAVLWGGQRPRGGGGVIPNISHLGMCHRISVGLMHRFGLKTSTDFVYFGLESGTGFEGATDVSERIYRFNSKRVRKKEKYENSKLILRNLLRMLSLKAVSENGCENDIFQNRVSIWTIERHASTTNSQEYPGRQKGQHFCWGVDSPS